VKTPNTAVFRGNVQRDYTASDAIFGVKSTLRTTSNRLKKILDPKLKKIMFFGNSEVA